jgi:hypothetical protein
LFFTDEEHTISAEQQTVTKNIDLTCTVLRGNYTVTVNGSPETSDWVNVHAYMEGEEKEYFGRGNDQGDWSLGGIPPGFSGTLHIGLEFGFEERWHFVSDIGEWTPGSPIPDLDVFILSGNYTVAVNGHSETPEIYVYAVTEEGEYPPYSGIGREGAWSLGIPSDFSGTLPISMGFELNGKDCSAPNVAAWDSDSSTSDIDLDVSGIGGTVTTDGSTLLDTGTIYVIDRSGSTLSDLMANATIINQSEITNGGFAMYVPGNIPSGYVVVETDSGYYITSSPVNLNTSMNLNITAMTTVTDDLSP